MLAILNSTPARIALAAVGTAAVAAGSYLVGKQHGVEEAGELFQQMLPEIIQKHLAELAETPATN